MIFITKKKRYLFIGAIGLLIFFHYMGWFGFVESFFYRLAVPISSSVYSLQNQIKNRYDAFVKRQQLSSIYQDYLTKTQEVELQKVQIEILKEEGEKLKALVNFKNSTKFTLISANVVGHSSSNLEKTYLVDVGQKDGVKTGQAVVVQNGILVGKISHVEKNISMLRLLSDNQSKIAATILNKAKSLGVVEGGYGLSIRMNLVPRNEIVLVKDKVVTSGLDPYIPRGLLIGEVAVSENEAYQPFQQAILTPAVDLSRLTVVAILSVSSN